MDACARGCTLVCLAALAVVRGQDPGWPAYSGQARGFAALGRVRLHPAISLPRSEQPPQRLWSAAGVATTAIVTEEPGRRPGSVPQRRVDRFVLDRKSV